MKLKFLSIPAALLATFSSFAQAPNIANVDKYSDGTGRRITISGTNFGTNLADIEVYFGAQNGGVVSVSDRLIEATVPPGATLEHITVTNTQTLLSAFSPQQFSLTYGGEHPFSTTASLTSPQEDFNGETGLFDLCLCDLDLDGKTDIVSTSKDANSITLFLNISAAPNDIQYTPTPFLIGAKTLHIRCGDLNGDGLKDLVLSESDPGERIFILRNTSTVGSLSFVQQSTTLTDKLPKQIDINDLDLDGKPEIIVSDQRSLNKDFVVLMNTSSAGNITLGPMQSISIPVTGTTGPTDGLAVHDLNSDGRPEVIITQFLTANGNVFIFENESSQGTLNLQHATTLTLNGATAAIRVGDLTGDGNPEIAATQLFAASVVIFKGESTPSAIQFAEGQAFETDLQPWGIDFGDLDGDGLPEIAVASISNTNKTITILNNTSTSGSLAFAAKQTISTSFVNRHIKIGDLSGDGKPDVAFASVDDATAGLASKISTLRNKGCIVPTIGPPGPLIVCTSFPVALEASVSAGATYQWKKNGTNIPLATNSTFTPVDVGTFNYTVDITSDGCLKSSTPTSVQVVAAGSVPAPTVTEDSPTCIGATVTLTAVSAGATGYEWTGPAGFEATGTSVTRPAFQIEFAGRYDVNVMVGTCVAQQGFVIVEAVTLPEFKIGFTGSDLICAGGSRLLTADPLDPDFTFQWFKDSNPTPIASGTTHTISATGDYFFRAQSVPFPSCPPAVSEHVVFRVVSLPAVAFASPPSFCEDIAATFTNQSLLDDDAGENFLWDFGDGGTSTDTSPTHIYANTGSFSVKLTAAYRDNACVDDLTKPITISPLPTGSIIAPGNIYEFCAGNNLTLSVDNTFTSYLWSTSETTPTIVVTAGDTYSVVLTNSIGCHITPTREVTQLSPPVVDVTAEPLLINIGETTQLTATAGFATYLWSPPETLSDPAISNPIGTPQEKTTYVVTATDADGCTAEGQVEVDVTFDDIVNLLSPGNFISPNSDNINDTWEVGSILNFQCGVKIFDEKGSKVYDALPYRNEWDALLNGKPLPNGVYFYYIQCEGESESLSGSITVTR